MFFFISRKVKYCILRVKSPLTVFLYIYVTFGNKHNKFPVRLLYLCCIVATVNHSNVAANGKRFKGNEDRIAFIYLMIATSAEGHIFTFS